MSDMESNGDKPAMTIKEMLHRLDGKIDLIAQKQITADLERAVMKENIRAVEKDLGEMDADDARWHLEVRKAIKIVEEQQQSISARQKATSIIVAGVVIISNIVLPILLRLIP